MLKVKVYVITAEAGMKSGERSLAKACIFLS